ncbi:MAG: hypothetical protein F4Y16_00605 [Holophagales bacterium]|nr:hypothetical protein [Holophagales bacterium]MYH26472.1 hypothetical protein [Holophagales bacterium]MYH27218.1 hypothetical protein [Holophagales bacterium]
MNHTISGVLSRSVLTLGLAALIALPAVAAEDDTPRMADGKPDLSGFYNIATLTPLQRPARYGDNLFLTAEEANAIEEEEQALLARANEKSDPNRAAPSDTGAAPVGFDDSQRENLGAGNVGGYNAFWIDRGSSAVSIDGAYRTSIISEPANGRMPPITDAARERRAARRALTPFRANKGVAWWIQEGGADAPGPYDDIEQRPHAERCIMGFGSTQGPPMLPALYNNHKRIVQTDTHVMILVEMNHDARVVRLNSEHDDPGVRKWLGDSIGWWEGDTMVVSTKNFGDRPGLSSASRDLHVTERFTRLDADTLHYEFTVDDPSTWAQPWQGDYVWPATTDKVYEYACHEGNYAMGNIMRGARLLESEALAAAAGTGGGE